MPGRTVRDLDRARRAVCTAALAAVPSAAAAGLHVLEPDGSVGAAAHTCQLAERLGQAQVVLGEGPSVDALRAALSSVPDLSRWPRFEREARRLGLVDALVVPLPGTPQATVLTLYACRPDAFDHVPALTARLLACQAAVALTGAHHVAHLQNALASRDLIGQAKGVLMERRHISSDEAFAVLVEASQHTNLRLADVAAWLISEIADEPAVVSRSE